MAIIDWGVDVVRSISDIKDSLFVLIVLDWWYWRKWSRGVVLLSVSLQYLHLWGISKFIFSRR